MLAGKLPELWRITIEDAELTIGSMRMEDFGYLAAFHLIHTLNIVNVNVPSIARLAGLISALPGLTNLWCINVDCLQKLSVSPVSLPLNAASLELLDVIWVAPAIQDLLARISQASRLRILRLGVDEDLTLSSAGSRSQTLLNASAASVEVLILEFDPDSFVDRGSDSLDSTVGKLYTFALGLSD
ncbi:hypothetical protein EVJ58_g7371 [Rhodofomes roseus]|uniref:Uncharacterized protein n=1 Tax=Rhodofomes roseus TaxID=34475 RepID=A0A4Y9Y3V3_9APHY|nr:hypothetical protein EVJ58_g7371 [Rhodofomes roseus]